MSPLAQPLDFVQPQLAIASEHAPAPPGVQCLEEGGRTVQPIPEHQRVPGQYIAGSWCFIARPGPVHRRELVFHCELGMRVAWPLNNRTAGSRRARLA
jgi:hypothetical protein